MPKQDDDAVAAAAKAEADAAGKSKRTPITDDTRPAAQPAQTAANPSGTTAETPLGELAAAGDAAGKVLAPPPTDTNVDDVQLGTVQPGEPRIQRTPLKPDVPTTQVMVPKAFLFVADDGIEHTIQAGLSWVRTEFLDHWWFKHHNVQVVADKPADTE